MTVTLFTIDCPNCKRLEEKLISSGFQFSICKDRNIMAERGMTHLPILVVDGNKMGFKEAIKWINDQRKGTM